MSHPALRAFRSSGAPTLVVAVLATLFLAAAPLEASYVGKWYSYTDKSRVTALIAHQGSVYAGTEGGIRRIDPATLAQGESGPTDGLVDPWITGFARDESGRLWAAARSGLLYRLAANGRWEIFGRSYAALQWQMNPRAILSAGNFLYVGTTRGLGVFDTRSMASEVNVTRFQDETELAVLSLLRRGDTLYVGTPSGVFRARVHFDDPRNPPPGFDNLRDHTRWESVALPPDTARRYDHLAFIGDSLATFEPGTLLQEAWPGIDIRVFENQPPEIGAQLYDDWGGFTSAAIAGGKVFIGGTPGLYVSPNPEGTARNAVFVAPPRPHSHDVIANLGVHDGRVWGHAGSGLYRFDAPARGFVAGPDPGTEGATLYTRFLRNLKVDVNGDVYVGTWGNGVYRWRNGTESVWKAEDASCLTQLSPGNAFTVVNAIASPRGDDLYFTVFAGEGTSTHQLAHLNTSTGAVTCVVDNAEGGYPHAVLALNDTLVAVATDRGVNLVTVSEGVTGPAFQNTATWTLAGTANEAWDLAVDESGRLWTLIGDQLAYFDSIPESTARRLKPIDNFTGTGCKSLESDPQGALWIGCENGLFNVETGVDASILSVRPYRADDGIPGRVIHDLAVDPVTGRLWAATDRGVAMYESPAQPPLPRGELKTITPYPNPYRADHRARGVPVVFRDVPPDATLRLHDPSGTVLRIFTSGERRGNQFQWDGRNGQGRAVKPGVYLFTVTAGGKVERGKVIVAP